MTRNRLLRVMVVRVLVCSRLCLIRALLQAHKIAERRHRGRQVEDADERSRRQFERQSVHGCFQYSRCCSSSGLGLRSCTPCHAITGVKGQG